MLKLNVPDMTCGHCVGMVTKAIKSVDADANVTIDLPLQTVLIETNADPDGIKNALETAGYPAKEA